MKITCFSGAKIPYVDKETRFKLRKLACIFFITLASSSAFAGPPSSNSPPTVTLTAPMSGQFYKAPAAVLLRANASDANGTVTSVSFYSGKKLLGTDTTAPYEATWSSVPVGEYIVTAKATDNAGAVAEISTNISVTNNAPPTVAMNSPLNGAVFTAPASVTLTATASDSDGILGVSFYQGNSSIGGGQAPYSHYWTNLVSGTYTVHASAMDRLGALSYSEPITFEVRPNSPPVVAMSQPAHDSTFPSGEALVLQAIATDSSGVDRVEYYLGDTFHNESTVSPYSVTWTRPVSGTYVVTAKAYDAQGLSTISTPITVTIAANSPPVVSWTAPTNNSSFIVGQQVQLTLAATDTDGGIAKVDFIDENDGRRLLGSVTQAPYSITVTSQSVRSMLITAIATDTQWLNTSSTPLAVSFGAPQQRVNFIHFDHLDTPRVISSSTNAAVWEWPIGEPYGSDVANQDPSSTGLSFEFNLRFPGQYFDNETGLHYNYHRDYDPQTGRYTQSDPIGLAGGINTYGYVGGNPISRTDPQGLLWDETGAFTITAAAAASKFNPLTAVASLSFGAGILAYEACHPDEGEKCKKIQADMLEAMGVIEGRLADMLFDKLNLFNLAYATPNPSLPPNSGSWTGHARQLESWQNRLRNLIPKAQSMGCKVPPHAYTLAYAKIPTRPGTRVR